MWKRATEWRSLVRCSSKDGTPTEKNFARLFSHSKKGRHHTLYSDWKMMLSVCHWGKVCVKTSQLRKNREIFSTAKFPNIRYCCQLSRGPTYLETLSPHLTLASFPLPCTLAMGIRLDRHALLFQNSKSIIAFLVKFYLLSRNNMWQSGNIKHSGKLVQRRKMIKIKEEHKTTSYTQFNKTFVITILPQWQSVG